MVRWLISLVYKADLKLYYVAVYADGNVCISILHSGEGTSYIPLFENTLWQ